MTSFYYASTPICGNWSQTNHPEHESDDRADDTVFVCVTTNEKDTAQRQILSTTFVTVLWCSKTVITDVIGILVLVRYDFQNLTVNIGIVSSRMHLKTSHNFNPIEITWRKMVSSVCLTPVSNGNVTFAYIMTFHCTRV